MRVLFLVDNIVPHGAQRTIVNIVSSFKRQGFGTHIQVGYIRDLGKTQTIKGDLYCPAIRVKSTRGRLFDHYDVVNAHVWEGSESLKLSRELNMPIVYTQHGATIMNAGLDKDSIHTVVSKYYPYAIQDENIGNVYPIQNALDPEKISKHFDTPRDKIFDIFPNITRRPIITTVSRCVRSKGYDLFLDICEKISFNATFIFIGASHINSDYSIFVKRAKKIGDNFIYTDFLPHDVVLDVIAGSDIFLITSRLESYCFRLYEAIALGIPVVTHQLYIGQDVNEYIHVSPFEDTDHMAINVENNIGARRPPSTDYPFFDLDRFGREYHYILSSAANNATVPLQRKSYKNSDCPDTIKNMKV